MRIIDEKFKDDAPENTVKKIENILSGLGIELNEKWNDSRIENCCSLRVTVGKGLPGTNGKGITNDFARASAYGEFMERMQSGLFFYKYQSFENDDSVYLHSYAPDKKYMTMEELIENGDWMDPITEKYGITRKDIATHCRIYSCSDKILTLPYYSLFEDKYVYLPQMFVEHIYSANGCCVGNTREEAWVHALSEIFERHSNIETIKSCKPCPVIPREKLKKFKTVTKIIETIEKSGDYDIAFLDYSLDKGFPVVAARIINKKNKAYLINVAADPVFEIAVERTLTEMFQGRNLDNFFIHRSGIVLNNMDDINVADNIINQLETGDGLYTVDFFCDDDGKDKTDEFADNSNKSNVELAKWVIDKYKKLGLNVYVRNNSFLGFPCYKFIVPGFSESRGMRLKESVPIYYFGDRAAKTLRNIKKADIAQLSELMLYKKMIASFISKSSNFTYLTGVPILGTATGIKEIHFAYAALKLSNLDLFNKYIDGAISLSSDDDADYLKCVKQWIAFSTHGVEKEKALKVIKKFYVEKTYNKLVNNIEKDALLDEYLLECEGVSSKCEKCKYKDYCCYKDIQELTAKVGKEYAKFTSGQAKENFTF